MDEKRLAEIEERAIAATCGYVKDMVDVCTNDVSALIAEVRRLQTAGRALAQAGPFESNGADDLRTFYACCNNIWHDDGDPHASDCPWPAFVEAFGD